MANVTELPTTIGGITITPANKQSPWGICMAIYGPAGVGKTEFASHAADSPYGNPVLFVDAEGGSRTFSHRDDIQVAQVLEWGQLQRLQRGIWQAPTAPFGTVVLDNLSEFQSVHMRSLVKEGDNPQIQDYGKNTQEMLFLTRQWRDYARRTGVNVILIAWESPEKDETNGRIKRDVGFTPSLARQFPGIVDQVGYLTVENDPPAYTRCLSFAPSPVTAAKFRRSRGEKAADIPLQLWYGANDKPLVDLLATLKGGQAFPKEKYAKPQRGGNPNPAQARP